MKKCSLGFGVILCTSLILGAARHDRSSSSPLKDSEAETYAENLLTFVINPVAENYVKPIPQADLLYAALAALHEQAHAPIPSAVRAEIGSAKSELDRIALVKRYRSSLGNNPALAGNNALLVSIRGLTKILDPHTVLIGGSDLHSSNLPVGCFGVGLEFLEAGSGSPPTVKTVMPGGPAQHAGIRPGDRIVSVNGKPTPECGSLVPIFANFPLLLSKPEGTQGPINVEFQRPGAERPAKVTLEPQNFRCESVLGVARQSDNRWDYFIDKENRIAHVRIAALAKGTRDELAHVLSALELAEFRGLILDLRWCPGGMLDEAVGIADLLLPDCKIVALQNRHGIHREYVSARENSFLDFPIVVLVNGESSGGAELIAAALQDNKRALIVGQRTFGKASVQRADIINLPLRDVAMKLTTDTFRRPNGQNLNRFPDSKPSDDWGVHPDKDLDCRISCELSVRLREWWLWQTLRPGSSNEALPLDDPNADPQRQFALERVLYMTRARAKMHFTSRQVTQRKLPELPDP